MKCLFDLSKCDHETRSSLEASLTIIAVITCCVATFVGTFFTEILAHFGYDVGLAWSTHLGATMLWILGFICSLVATAIFLFAISCVALFCSLVYGLSRFIAIAMKSCC